MISQTGLLSALVFALFLGARARADIVDRLDQSAADVTSSKWWNGAAPKIESLRGKVVVLHISDPARATSRGFVPNLVKLAAAYKSEPVVFIEVVENDDESVASKYVAECAGDIKWQVGWDGTGALQRGYPGSSVPRTYVIGPDGRVAWHAHIAALKPEIVDAQIKRCGFYDVKSVPEKARPAAKAMLEYRFADAIEAADKVFTDAYADSEAKAFCATVKREVSRYYTFQKTLADTLMKDLDWAVAFHRVERMLVVYKGTDHEPEVRKLKDELDANPRVKFIVEAQNRLDEMVKDIGRMTAKELEKLVEKLKAFNERYPDTSPAK